MMADYSIEDIIKSANALPEPEPGNVAIHPSSRDWRMKEHAEEMHTIAERLNQLAEDYLEYNDQETARRYRFASYYAYQAGDLLKGIGR